MWIKYLLLLQIFHHSLSCPVEKIKDSVNVTCMTQCEHISRILKILQITKYNPFTDEDSKGITSIHSYFKERNGQFFIIISFITKEVTRVRPVL